jgi:hypothetical protein
MSAPLYCDTSALAKWYVAEPRSEDVVALLREEQSVTISTLTALELRCLLARRRRAGDFSAEYEMRAFATFEQDLADGHVQMYPLDDHATRTALFLVAQLPDHPLRTLDALQLALARDLSCPRLATADRTMAAAAAALGFDVRCFA